MSCSVIPLGCLVDAGWLAPLAQRAGQPAGDDFRHAPFRHHEDARRWIPGKRDAVELGEAGDERLGVTAPVRVMGSDEIASLRASGFDGLCHDWNVSP